jgi:hypothetical protein
MRKVLTLMLGLGLTLGLVVGFSQAGTRDAAIKQVMKEAMKGGLCKKVVEGQASAADKEELLKLFKDLAAATPPNGEAESWTTKTKALVSAAQAAVDGSADASAKLKAAANCKACHDVHK